MGVRLGDSEGYVAAIPTETGRIPQQGDDRTRTGVNGFAGRWIAALPRRQEDRKVSGRDVQLIPSPRATAAERLGTSSRW